MEGRQEQKIGAIANRSAWLQWATLAVCIATLALVGWSLRNRSDVAERIDERIALASAMINRGLPAEAIEEYKAALELARGDKRRKANICYLVGRTYLQTLKDYESALAYFARAEHYGLRGPQRGQMEKWVVECLERLGRSLDARNRMAEATALRPKSRPSSSVVVARIGDEEVTMADLEAEIRRLPPPLQRQLADPKKKADFLEQVVARRLLVAAAERANLHRDPDVLGELERSRDEILLRAYVEREIAGKVDVTPEEIRLYYEAHRDEFKRPRVFDLSHIEVRDKETATSVAAALERGQDFAALARRLSIDKTTREKAGKIGPWREGETLPAPLGDDPQTRRAISQLRAGRWTEPIETASGTYRIVRADAVSSPTVRPLDEVRETIASQLRREKIRRRQQEILDRLRKAENVVIYRDVIVGAGGRK